MFSIKDAIAVRDKSLRIPWNLLRTFGYQNSMLMKILIKVTYN